MYKSWETFFIEIIQGKHKKTPHQLFKYFLRFCSFPFQGIVACRNWAYDRGYFKTYSQPNCFVISIGNIVAGGTGKTPVTLMLAQELAKEASIAILSRGYRSTAEKRPSPTILSKGKGPLLPVAECGDEPFLLSRRIPQALVVVGKDRKAAAHIAVESGAKIVLLDDGMQHRCLARNLDLVVMNAHDLFGQGFFLPGGFLRDSKKSLSRANLIILNHVRDQQDYESLCKQIASYSSSPVIGTRMVVESWKRSDGIPIEQINGKRVGVFSGIAQPESFHRMIQEKGAHLVAERIFSDHHCFSREDLRKFAEEAKANGAEILLCTEKDQVKIMDLFPMPLPIAWPEMRLSVVFGHEHWDSFLQSIKV